MTTRSRTQRLHTRGSAPIRNLEKNDSLQMRGLNPSIGKLMVVTVTRYGRSVPAPGVISHRNSEAVLAQSPWFRCLIRPQPGYGLVLHRLEAASILVSLLHTSVATLP